MSIGDGTFALPLNLPRDWSLVYLETGPGYDDGNWRFEPKTAGTRAEIRIYPTLVIRPGESIDVRVQPTVNSCAFTGAFPCRRVLVVASLGEPVELEFIGDANAFGLTNTGFVPPPPPEFSRCSNEEPGPLISPSAAHI
jgi:hypothetical protein